MKQIKIKRKVDKAHRKFLIKRAWDKAILAVKKLGKTFENLSGSLEHRGGLP